mgnify:CR=1 FL=1
MEDVIFGLVGAFGSGFSSFGSLFSQNTNIFDETFDPSNLVEPNLKLPLIVKPNDENPEFLNNTIVDSIIDGFRIQVASTNDLDFANSLSNNILLPK